jgi:hypothetical protein
LEPKAIKSKTPWLVYAAELLTILFALMVLAGRVYEQSYWHVFGLNVGVGDISFISYAIASPNAAIASVSVAIGAIFIIALFRGQFPDLVGDNNPRFIYILGTIIFFLGMLAIGFVMRVNTSTWPLGLAGLLFGIGYLAFIGSPLIWSQAILKLPTREPSKFERSVIRLMRNLIPLKLFILFLVVGIFATSIWAIVDTSQKFGSNEAKQILIEQPEVIIQLDSVRGFEDIIPIMNLNGTAPLKARVITKHEGFLYVYCGGTTNPLQIYIRAIPYERIQSIKYSIDITPIGE